MLICKIVVMFIFDYGWLCIASGTMFVGMV